MYTEERRLLTDFLDQLKQAEVFAKDSEAENLINQAVAQQPDAAYLLVQKALLQEQALNAAKTQIAQLQNQLDRLRTTSSQSGGVLGSDPRNLSSDRLAPAQPTGGLAASSYAPSMAEQSAAVGFLGTTAGAFLFQGIESLLHRDSEGGFRDSASTSENAENIAMNKYDNADEPISDFGLEQADFVDDGVYGFDGYDADESSDL